ncbi:MAG: hypothetical protein ACC645_06545 [Pirellulales bacterium]
MKKREKNLAVVFGAIVLGLLGNQLFKTAFRGPLESRKAAVARKERQIKSLEKSLAKAREAAKELAVWQSQSLPSDTSQAGHLYQEWLTKLVNRIGLTVKTTTASDPVNRKGFYHMLVFSVRGRGTLEQLVEFLFEFYSADYLHKIQSLDITPNPQNDQLDVTVSIEALVLPGADRKDRLTRHKSDRLASRSLADYRPIVQRNIFHIGGSGPDATDHAFLTAVIDVGGQPEAWFTLRTTDKTLKLRKGQKLEVGPFRGTIVEIEIEGADVVIESDDERWLLTVGENLAQATSLPPEH